MMLQVAIGAAIGATIRLGITACFSRALSQSFPFGVMAVNVIGCFAMGVVVAISTQTSNSQFNAFVMTGVLGGMTTFSAFSLDSYTLIERGEIGAAALYVFFSVSCSIIALFAGVIMTKACWF